METLDGGIGRAYGHFKGLIVTQNHKKADLSLRFRSLHYPPAKLRAVRRWIDEHCDAEGFVQKIDLIIDWRSRVERMSGEDLFLLSREYEQGGKREQDRYIVGMFRLIASAMKERAADRGHVDAVYELAEIELASDVWWRRDNGADRLKKLALAGEAKAALDLARRYQDGRGVAKDDTRALYWFIRARGNGAVALDQDIRLLRQRLTPEQALRLRTWAESNRPPR